MNYHMKSSFTQINESWHIPRASLGSITSSQSGSQKSYSNPSTMKYHKKSRHHLGQQNRGYHSEDYDDSSTEDAEKKRQRRRTMESRKIRDIDKTDEKNKTKDTLDGIKRGSHSSQGSTASNQSSHSASSGSFLLTAANLEQLAQIHTKNPLNHQFNYAKQHRPLYNANITLQQSSTAENNAEAIAAGTTPSVVAPFTVGAGGGSGRTTLTSANDIEANPASIMDANYLHVKTKDLDAMSMASSTHFTVVNGMGGPQRIPKDGICSRGHQITVLILTMSLMFLIGIAGAVFLLEMRAKKMPH